MGLVYCRQCRGLASEEARCPACGTADPGALASAAWGVLVYGTLLAAAATGAYAFALSLVGERWVNKFDRLPPDHLLHGSGHEVAYGIGLAVFAVSWVLAVCLLLRNLGSRGDGEARPVTSAARRRPR